MKLGYILFSLVLLSSCGSNQEDGKNGSQLEAKKEINTEIKGLNGIYHYTYPDNTSDLNEDHFIILSSDGNSLKGKYYGTSDEFDENREGYLPGFFVADLKNIQHLTNTINFFINIDTSEVFTNRIPLDVKSSKDAKEKGYKSWKHIRAFTNEATLKKNYTAKVIGDTLYFKGDIPDFDKYFVKIPNK